MKKAFDQTVRDLKREVNKKVLKVPSIEQKILDATSNEPWGPHGTLLADIAQATRNYHEYQIIMTVVWKRVNDTGKNWRHVYKALTVLEYLVGHGSERVIDEIREHAYQISTLSDFQYLDSSGRDQGNNVRRKSQTLVSLVNDKEKIQEARQKALSNKDKYRSSYSTSGSRPGYGDRYDDDRYGNRDEDRNGYGRERDWGNRDDDRYSRGGDAYREGDRYSRDSDEHYGRDNYKDDDYRAPRGNDDYQSGARRRSFDRDGDRSLEDDERYPTRNSTGRADEFSQDERRLERRRSDPNVAVPPSYEEAIRNAKSRLAEERSMNDKSGTEAMARASSPPVANAASIDANGQEEGPSTSFVSPGLNEKANDFDVFDPRGSSSAPPFVAKNPVVDLFGASAAPGSADLLALVPVTSTASEADVSQNSSFGMNFVPLSTASDVLNQPTENPFGDAPFKAAFQVNAPAQFQNFSSTMPFQTTGLQVGTDITSVASDIQYDRPTFVEDSIGPIASTHVAATGSPNIGFVSELPTMQGNTTFGGLGYIRPHSGNVTATSPLTNLQAAPAVSNNLPDNFNDLPKSGHLAPIISQGPPVFPQMNQQAPPTSNFTDNFNLSQPAQSTASVSQGPSVFPQTTYATPAGTQFPYSPNFLANPGLSTALAHPAVPTASSIPYANTQPSNDRFSTKSTVWADTLSRGIVNLNISGPKANPTADIGIDFDSLNRMDKRKEKVPAAPMTSAVNMGKAMGSGSGIGRTGASSLVPPANPMIGSVGGGMPGMAAYGASINQPMGSGMGIGQAAGMRPPMGMPGVGYNPMTGSQQPYGGPYR